MGHIARQRPVPLLHFFPLQHCWAAKHDPITRLARSLALTRAHLGPLFPCYPSLQAARDADGLFKGADALIIDSGANNEDELYSKSKALQMWLIGYEFPETVIAVCSRSIHILTSKKKVG